MKKIVSRYINLLFGVFLLVNLSCKEKQQETLNYSPKETRTATVLKIDRVSSLRKTLMNPKDSIVMVTAHRGDWRHAPQNSVQAIKNAIAMGVDIVEIDVRRTKDGQLVLMHDSTIDRATDGSGKVSDYTLEELEKFHLKNGLGRPTHHQIPTLEEAMLAAKGKVLINLDKSYDYFDQAYQILEKTGTLGQVIMKGYGVSAEQLKKEHGEYLDKIFFMPVIHLDDPDAESLITGYETTFKPVAFEFVFKDEKSAILNQFEEIRRKGSRVWANSLWSSLNAGHEDDMAVMNRDSIYGWYIKKGVDIIQTDRPALLLDYLRSKKLHD